MKLMVQQCSRQGQEHGPGVALPGVVKWTREPSGSCLTFSPCTHPLQSSAPGTLANTPFRRHRATSLWRGGEGLSGVPRGNLVAPCRADSHSPKPSGLALQWASPHRSLPCGIPPAFWPGGGETPLQCPVSIRSKQVLFTRKNYVADGVGCSSAPECSPPTPGSHPTLVHRTLAPRPQVLRPRPLAAASRTSACARLVVGCPPVLVWGSPCSQAEMHTPSGQRQLREPLGGCQWRPGPRAGLQAGVMSLAPFAAPRHGPRFLQNTKTKPCFVVPGIQGACSQKWNRAAFPLSVTSPSSSGHQTPSNLGRWEEL